MSSNSKRVDDQHFLADLAGRLWRALGGQPPTLSEAQQALDEAADESLSNAEVDCLVQAVLLRRDSSADDGQANGSGRRDGKPRSKSLECSLNVERLEERELLSALFFFPCCA